MDAIDIPVDNVPADLRPVEQTLRRAAELKKVDPVVSYWCCFWAAQKALKIPNRSREGTAFLMRILDALEEMKAALGDNEAVSNEAVGSAHVENFALKVFMGADNAERAGDFGKATIRKFVVAGQFIDVLNAFETGMSEEIAQKAKYAKWKAADLAKCLREGRTPVSGPPVDPLEAELAALGPPADAPTDRRGSGSGSGGIATPTSRASASLAPTSPPDARSPLATSPDLPSLPGVPAPASMDRTLSGGSARSGGSGLELPSAPVGLERTLSDSSGGFGLPSVPPPLPLPSLPGVVGGAPAFDSTPVSDNEEEEAPGPEVQPRSNASRFFIDLLSPEPDPPSSPPSVAPVARSAPSAPPLSPPPVASPPHAPPRAPPPTSPPRAPPTSAPVRAVPAPVRAAPVIPPPAPVPARLGPVRELSRAETERCQKHCRWAISALEFEDPETARTELLKALAMLS
ncbi:hypothetical protein CcaverHIS002_0505720 [Cutaneotrichosporon cavernicola]|uniref:DUF605-domain-containing protein n=1 Tax=Cutaneotrichosporon cavernicola TaxID=279322 RepID=A0AA48L6R9_9TREE|nr:uncharacterized protein CcaverHIS019_0506250 [Cutaneotrichosporon cavernicola]BEI85171.1 hypothetical protein CcaverHIS002_0505720 [Cutaneotrichosporon cavernicola]BEI92997.1 hypothetical protein CcaverHIS019_0506250 [Cutaneotrichosporon cavernicola]BEJ00773.1 hypothetical protein CcaverHIS631_0506300 [Cutaneotrichosporon cavernicola]BEJ08538.1 hypothetical protein CcaverHIS641_0506320 [Cutaneotrichosporon cavernicola]